MVSISFFLSKDSVNSSCISIIPSFGNMEKQSSKIYSRTRNLPGVHQVSHPTSQKTANSLEKLAATPNHSIGPGLQMCSSHNAFLGPVSELLLAFCCFSRLNPLEIGFSLKRSLFWLRIQSMWNNQVR